MSDEEKYTGRHRTATDMGLPSRLPQRASTVSDGTPSEVDNDHTPVPVSPPNAETFRHLTESTQIEALRLTVERNAQAIAHEQQVRHEGEEIGELKAKVAALGHLGNEMVEVRTKVDALNRSTAGMDRKLDRLVAAAIATNVRREGDGAKSDAMQSTLSAINSRTHNMQLAQVAQDGEIKAVRERVEGLAVGLDGRLSVVEKTIGKLVVEKKAIVLASRMQKLKAAGKAGGFATVLAYVLSQIASHLSHLIH